MAFETRTYDELSKCYQRRERERLDRISSNEQQELIEFEKHNNDPEVYRSLRKNSQRARTQIEGVLRPQWADIRISAEDAVMKQMALFNELYADNRSISPWHERFQFLSQLPQGKQSAALKTMHTSKSERLMRAFSRRDLYPVPISGASLSTVFLDAIIVMSDRIPDELVQSLGLVTFEDGNTPLDRLDKKESLECTTALKELVKHSHPLAGGNYRILVLPDGRLLYTSGNGEDDEPGSPLEARVYDAYGALRKTHHQPRLYDKEIAKLERIAEEIKLFIQKMDTKWKADTPQPAKQELMAKAAQLSDKWTQEFDACRNRYKVEARKLIAEAQTLTDSSGKSNPSRSLSKYVAATNRMRERCEKDIADKGSFNYKDQVQLTTEIGRHENRMRSFRQWLQDNADHLSTPDDLRSAPSLKGLRLQPFCAYADRLMQKMQELCDALQAGNGQAVKEHAVETHVIGKAQELRSCLASVQQDIIDPEGALLSEIRERLDRFREYFAARQIATDVTVASYEQPFEEMQQRFEALIELLGDPGAPDRRVSRGDPLYKALKQFIKDFNVEEMVQRMQ